MSQNGKQVQPKSAVWDDNENHWHIGLKDSHGQAHGPQLTYRKGGSLSAFGFQEHGLSQGPAFRFHENGEISQIANYTSGELTGLHHYCRSSEVTTEQFFDGAPTGIKTVIFDHDSGAIQGFLDWEDNPVSLNDIKNGNSFVDKDTALSRKSQSASQIPPTSVPLAANWLETHKMWAVGLNFADNKTHGPYMYFSAEGNLTTVCNFAQCIPVGPLIGFHPNGEISQTCEYSEKGQLIGQHIYHRHKDFPNSPFPPGAPEVIKTMIMEYNQGFPEITNLYDWEGQELDPHTLEPYQQESAS